MKPQIAEAWAERLGSQEPRRESAAESVLKDLTQRLGWDYEFQSQSGRVRLSKDSPDLSSGRIIAVYLTETGIIESWDGFGWDGKTPLSSGTQRIKTRQAPGGLPELVTTLAEEWWN